jgi:glycosyltransferase 2 family protein
VKSKRTLLHLAKLVFASAILYFIIRTVLNNWAGIESYTWDFNPLYMVISVIVFFAGYVLLAWIWAGVLRSTGNPVSFGEAWDIYFIGNLGRYIPGKVWTIALTAYMSEKHRVPGVTAATASVFAQAYSVLSSLVIFALFFILYGYSFAGIHLDWTAPVFVIFLLVFLAPKNLERALNRLLARMGRTQCSLGLDTIGAVKIMFFYLLSWILFGAAFWIFVMSVTNNHSLGLFFLTGVFVVSNVTGFFAVFVPGGLGVREWIIGILLAGYVPAGVGILVAFLLRLLTTLVELICVLFVLIRKGSLYGKEKAAISGR